MGSPDTELLLADPLPSASTDLIQEDASSHGPPSSAPPSLRRITPLLHLVGFTVTIIAISAVLTLIAKVWLDHLSWWTVFRRCASISSFIALWAFMRYLHRQPIRSLGLGAWRAGKRPLFRGAATGVIAAFALGAIYLASGACEITLTMAPARLWGTLLVFVPAAIIIGTLEELIFRGYILRQLMAYSMPVAVAISSVAYALVHFRAAFEWPNTGFELVGLFLLGCVLSLSALRTGQLYLSIGLHAVLAYFARINKLVVAFPEPKLLWLIGTSRLVNGILPWMVLLIIGWVIIRRTGTPPTKLFENLGRRRRA